MIIGVKVDFFARFELHAFYPSAFRYDRLQEIRQAPF